MPNIPRLIGHGAYAVALFVLLIFSGSEYDWMAGMDGAVDPGQIDGSGNRAVLAGLALFVALGIQGTLAATAPSRNARRVALVLAAAAALLFLFGQGAALA